MILDDFDIAGLPENSQEAFSKFETQVRSNYEERSRNDQSNNTDQHGNYIGSYAPERSYVMRVLAFLDEYSLETDIEDISELENDDFYRKFGKFKSKIEYITTRYALRKARIDSGSIGTLITFAKDYKTEIGGFLEKIRKIVNKEVETGNKKENIFKKISSLQSEVDRDQTTVDAAFGRVIDLGAAIGEAGGNLKPAVDQLERLKKILWDGSKKVDQLPKPERPKQITKDETGEFSNARDLDDEIPF